MNFGIVNMSSNSPAEAIADFLKSILPTKGGNGSSTLQAMNLEDGITTDTTKIANGFGFFFSNIATELKIVTKHTREPYLVGGSIIRFASCKYHFRFSF